MQEERERESSLPFFLTNLSGLLCIFYIVASFDPVVPRQDLNKTQPYKKYKYGSL